MFTALLLSAAAVMGPLDQDLALSKARWSGALLLAYSETAVSPDTPPLPDNNVPDNTPDGRPDPNCRKCRGTGKVRSGDGLIQIPCDCVGTGAAPTRSAGCTCGPDCSCGPTCTCAPAVATSTASQDQPARVRYEVAELYTARWCSGCPVVLARLEELRQSGLDVGTHATATWRIVHTDRWSNTDYAQHGITSLPYLIVKDQDGVVISRLDGRMLLSMSAQQLRDLLAPRAVAPVAPAVSVTPPVVSAAPVNPAPAPAPATTRITTRGVQYYHYAPAQPCYGPNCGTPRRSGLFPRLFRR